MNTAVAKPIPCYLVYSGAGLIPIKNLLHCKVIRPAALPVNGVAIEQVPVCCNAQWLQRLAPSPIKAKGPQNAGWAFLGAEGSPR